MFNIFVVVIIIWNINTNFFICSWVSRGSYGGYFKRIPRFSGKTADQKLSWTIIRVINGYHRPSWRIKTSSKWVVVDDSRWYCMLAGGQTEGHASTIIDYHEPLALIDIESRWANMVWSLVYYKVNARGLQWRKFHIAKSDLVWNLRLSNKFLYACTVIRFLRQRRMLVIQ